MKIKYLLKSLFIVLSILIFIGCGSTNEPEPTDIDSGNLELEVNNITRSLEYSIPIIDSYPLIIALHGGGDSISTFIDYAQITPLVNTTKRFGVVYPIGVDNHWNDGRLESGSSADDIAFIQNIITYYKEKGANEIYVVGMSNGGVMAQRVACELSDEIDGIMAVSATQTTYLEENCTNNTTPIKSLFIFGDNDTVFLDNKDIVNPIFTSQTRGTHIGIEETINYWLNRNGCLSILSDVSTLDNIDDQTSINIKEGTNCNQAVSYYEVINGGHRWPDPTGSNNLITTSVIGYASHEISTAEEMMKFFGL